MRLAVCLLTADRPEYTAETVASYVTHADKSSHIRLHADDGSERRDNIQIAAAGDFETVYATTDRRGPVAALRCMWAHALALGATHILHLENDIEFVAPLPAFDTADCVRLYGERKARSGPRQMTGPFRIGTRERIVWTPDFTDMTGNDWSRGFAHWGGMPSITRADLLVRAATPAKTLKDICYKLNSLDTIRPRVNLAWHIGDIRTPGAKFNQ